MNPALLILFVIVPLIVAFALAAITSPFIKHRATMDAFGLTDDPAPQPTPAADNGTEAQS